MEISHDTLVAYALGEIENPIDREEIRAELERDANMRTALCEILEVSAMLKNCEAAPADAFPDAGARGALLQNLALHPEEKRKRPYILAWACGAFAGAAACILLMFAVGRNADNRNRHMDAIASEVKKAIDENPLSTEERLDIYIESLKFKHALGNS